MEASQEAQVISQNLLPGWLFAKFVTRTAFRRHPGNRFHAIMCCCVCGGGWFLTDNDNIDVDVVVVVVVFVIVVARMFS